MALTGSPLGSQSHILFRNSPGGMLRAVIAPASIEWRRLFAGGTIASLSLYTRRNFPSASALRATISVLRGSVLCPDGLIGVHPPDQ